MGAGPTWSDTRSPEVLPGISIDAPVRARIPSNTSDNAEFSASIVRNFPSHEIIGARAGAIGGSWIIAGGGMVLTESGVAGFVAGA
jgi:hypothetical protein